MASLEVGNCAGCPYILQCEDKLQEFSEQKAVITRLALDSSIDSIVAPNFMGVLRETPALADVDVPSFETKEEIAAAIRMNTAALLEEIDRREDMIVTITNAGTATCNGPLKMRDTKDDITTTTITCNNPGMPLRSNVEPVVVIRERKS